MSNNHFTSVVPNQNGRPNVNVPLLGKPKTFPRSGLAGRIQNMVNPLKHEPKRRERLMKAIEDGNEEEAIRLVRDTGMSPDDLNSEAFIHYAVKDKRIDLLKALITAGAKVDTRFEFSIQERDVTPLHIATRVGFTEGVRALLAAGAEVDSPGNFGRTCLFVAAAHGNVEIITILLEAGANIESAKDFGRTPLYVAASFGQADAVRALLAAGANANAADKDGETPLYVAAKRHSIDTVNAMLDGGGNVDHALNIARRNGEDDIVQFLIASSGADKLTLNGPLTDRNFNTDHPTDPVTLDDIREGEEYYMINENVNPYTKSTMKKLLEANPPISPTTRKLIKSISKHRRQAATPASGGRKRTRKHHSKKRKTRRKA